MAKISAVWLDDLMTPGFNSSDKSTWASLKSKSPFVKEYSLEYGDRASLPKGKAKETTVQNASLVEIVKHIDSMIVSAGLIKKRFMLLEPMSLTVLRNEKYSKYQSIGGEDFILTGAYLGKKNDIIYTFKPTAVESYQTMEMTMSMANEKLSGFHEHVRELVGRDVTMEVFEIKELERKTVEVEKNADKANQYSEWGDW